MLEGNHCCRWQANDGQDWAFVHEAVLAANPDALMAAEMRATSSWLTVDGTVLIAHFTTQEFLSCGLEPMASHLAVN